MAYLNDALLDAALAVLDNCDRLDICSQEPATWANVGTYTLGTKASPTIGAVGDGTPNGRKRTVAAITSGAPGSVTGTGTGSHWALSDSGTSLLAAYSLSAPQALTSGNSFTLTAFDLRFSDPS